MTGHCLNYIFETRVVQVVDSATVPQSQPIPYHVNESFSDEIIIDRSSEQIENVIVERKAGKRLQEVCNSEGAYKNRQYTYL